MGGHGPFRVPELFKDKTSQQILHAGGIRPFRYITITNAKPAGRYLYHFSVRRRSALICQFSLRAFCNYSQNRTYGLTMLTLSQTTHYQHWRDFLSMVDWLWKYDEISHPHLSWFMHPAAPALIWSTARDRGRINAADAYKSLKQFARGPDPVHWVILL